MSERERQRHAHRARVDAAAREWQRVGGNDFARLFARFMAGRNAWGSSRLRAACEALDAALSAPKPWRKA